MALYHNLFYSIYSFLKAIELGYYYQDDSNRAFGTIATITMLEMFNLFSLAPLFFRDVKLYTTVAILFGVNFFLFYYKKKYKGVVAIQKQKADSKLTVVSILYILASVVGYLYTNVFCLKCLPI
jgi:hypothetical protein